MALLNMVGKLAKVQLGELRVSVEPILAETEFREATHHVTLTAFEASSDSASSTCILSLVTFTCGLSKARARSSANTFCFATSSWVVPESRRREGQQRPVLHLLSYKSIEGSELAARAHHHRAHHEVRHAVEQHAACFLEHHH